ncbi:MAG: hypothetical protein HC869_05500 [Rhodospirillales bacterium]|nr:hypothetical protein [Rhodospirillales bacterium]
MENFAWNKLIFDYLNNNQHKFDQHGNFDPTPDEWDYVPFGAITYYNGGWGGRPRGNNAKINKPKYAGKYKEGQGPDDLAKEHMEYHARDFENGIRYDEEKCRDIKNFEEGLCFDGYQGRALQACLARVNDRHDRCKKDHHLNNAPKMWTAEDMSGQPVGDEDLDKRRKSKSKQKPQPQPAPKPQDKQDKSEFSIAPGLASMMAMNPYLLMVTPEGQSRMNAFLNKLVLMPEDYPEGMRPLSKWSPTPATSAAASILPVPFGGAATLRVPTSPPR